MGQDQLENMAGAFILTGVITRLLLWPLGKFLSPSTAIVAASLICLTFTCAMYGRGLVAGLSVYGLPQVLWLVILAVAIRFRVKVAARAPQGEVMLRQGPDFDVNIPLSEFEQTRAGKRGAAVREAEAGSEPRFAGRTPPNIGV